MITIYKTTTCAYCPLVCKYLDMKGVKYKLVNLEDDPKLWQKVMFKSNAMTVPITVKDDWEAFVVGWQPGKLAELIK